MSIFIARASGDLRVCEWSATLHNVTLRPPNLLNLNGAGYTTPYMKVFEITNR